MDPTLKGIDDQDQRSQWQSDKFLIWCHKFRDLVSIEAIVTVTLISTSINIDKTDEESETLSRLE